MRVFQYGFAVARQGRRVSKDGSRITLTMPATRTIYRESTGKTPDVAPLRMEFPGNGHCDYEMEAFKTLDQSVESLEERNMALLLPFCPLKFRKEMKKAATTGGSAKK
ncbi:MAG: hypothetical protein LBG43_04875 [Treponema sp.]|jgi:hypothetical protein|nr:hypothetical protein [Treponema sp.]